MVAHLTHNQRDTFHTLVESLQTEPMLVSVNPRTGSVTQDQPPNDARAYAMPTVTVVIPARNEARNLPHVLPQIPPIVTEVILVDGQSEDETIQLAQSLIPTIRIIHQTGRGKGDALRCGVAASTSDIIVLMDADGSNDPQEIVRFVATLLAGADYVKGSRYIAPGGSDDITGVRSFGNHLLTAFANLLFSTRFTDFCYGYNAFWRCYAETIPINCDGFEVEAQLNSRAVRAGLRVTETPSYEWPRRYGASNLRPLRDGWRIARTILRERIWRAPVGARRGMSVDTVRTVATPPSRGFC